MHICDFKKKMCIETGISKTIWNNPSCWSWWTNDVPS